MSFFENFCKDFPDGVASVLAEEGFDTLPALLSASREDIEGLKTKKGHIAPVREAVTVLQFQHGKAPLCVGLPQDSNSGQRQDASSGTPNITISQLPGSLTVKEHSQSSASTAGCLHIADFVSSSLFVEEEAELGGGVTLKLNTGPKLETVSPAMWITATSRILYLICGTQK